MAIPLRPKSPQQPSVAQERPAVASAPELPGLPDVAVAPQRQRPAPQLSQPARQAAPAVQSAPAAPVEEALPEGWRRDPKTGKKYRELPGAGKEAIGIHNANGKSGLTYDQFLRYVPVVEDFDIEDLTSTADEFLAHLRVPPDKEEQKRLAQEKVARQAKQDEAYRKRLAANPDPVEETPEFDD